MDLDLSYIFSLLQLQTFKRSDSEQQPPPLSLRDTPDCLPLVW